MESTDSSAFLSGFCNYYSVLSGEEDLAVSSCVDPMPGTAWCEVSSQGSSHEEVLQYLEYYEECPKMDVITIHAMDGSDTGESVSTETTTTMTTDTAVDYFTYNIDQGNTPIFLSDPAASVIDLDCLTDSCPFDWDLNLENLITTKTEALPDLTPICNDICGEYLEDDVKEEAISRDPLSTIDSAKPTYQCSYGQCRKVYAKAAHLRSHIRRHLGDKPYICTWQNCLWRFNRSDELARHRRSHSGQKPYGCDYCPKRFSRSDHLSKHRKVHERKFASGKAKGVWRVLPKAKPGRKPKALKQLEEAQNSLY